MSYCLLLWLVQMSPSMKQTEDCWNEKESGERGAHQSADHGAAQRRIFLAAIAQAKRHRNHADDHRKRRHQHRPEAGKSGFHGGQRGVTVMRKAFFGERNHQNAVGGRHPYAHDGAGQSRNAQRSMSDKQKKDNAAKRGWERRDDDEWIEPRLEVHHDQHVHQNDGETQAGKQAEVRGMHGFELPANAEKAAPWKKMLVGLHDLRNVAPNAGEIATLHRTVNIHHAPDVVVRERFHLIAAVDRRHVGEYLWTNHSRSTDGNVLQIRQRLNCVLRRLRHKVIVHAVLLVQKEDGRGLETAAERNQQAGRDIALAEAALLGLGSVHRYVKLRVVECLLDAQVG